MVLKCLRVHALAGHSVKSFEMLCHSIQIINIPTREETRRVLWRGKKSKHVRLNNTKRVYYNIYFIIRVYFTARLIMVEKNYLSHMKYNIIYAYIIQSRHRGFPLNCAPPPIISRVFLLNRFTLQCSLGLLTSILGIHIHTYERVL